MYDASGGNSELARVLIQSGADLSLGTDLGRTPLHAAAQSGNLVALKLLIVAKADLIARDKEGKTPLDVSLSSGQEEAAEIIRYHLAKQKK